MTLYGSSEEMMHAARIMRDAADRMERAAQNIQSSLELMARHFDPDWGGEVPKLIELLEAAKDKDGER